MMCGSGCAGSTGLVGLVGIEGYTERFIRIYRAYVSVSAFSRAVGFAFLLGSGPPEHTAIP